MPILPKAAGYGEYAQLEAWRHRNPFCPGAAVHHHQREAGTIFLAASDREIDSPRMLVACVGLALYLRRCVLAPEWMVGEGEP